MQTPMRNPSIRPPSAPSCKTISTPICLTSLLSRLGSFSHTGCVAHTHYLYGPPPPPPPPAPAFLQDPSPTLVPTSFSCSFSLQTRLPQPCQKLPPSARDPISQTPGPLSVHPSQGSFLSAIRALFPKRRAAKDKPCTPFCRGKGALRGKRSREPEDSTAPSG